MKRIGWGLLVLILALSGAWVVPQVNARPKEPGNGQHAGNRHERGARPHGDPLVRKGLIAATAEVTGQRPREIRALLESGKSIEQIVQAAGKRSSDVLVRFDAEVDRRMQRAVERERLPQSIATARAAWFKQSARLQLDQPGLNPPFPGLHELHGMMIGAAVRVTGLRRADIRAQLESCKTLTEVAASKGRQGADVAKDALAQVDAVLTAWVSEGKLAAAQRDEWRVALQSATTNMIGTPGLHVAGKSCAK